MESPKAEFDWLTFLSNWHEKEYERRYTLENVVITPITLLTGAYGLAYLLFTQYDFKHSELFCSCLFVGSLVTALAFAVWSSFFVYKSYAVVKNKTYTNMPVAPLLRKHMDELVAYYKEHEPSADGVQKFKEYFVEMLANQISVNVENNDDRTVNIQQSKKPVMRAFLALFVALICFLFNQMQKPDPTYNVSLLPTTAMSKTATTPPPVLPTPPPPREIKSPAK
jgi:hypothetical protein